MAVDRSPETPNQPHPRKGMDLRWSPGDHAQNVPLSYGATCGMGQGTGNGSQKYLLPSPGSSKRWTVCPAGPLSKL